MDLVDISEQWLLDAYPAVLDALLADRTTGRNIIWATSDYEHLGALHQQEAEITVASITGQFGGVIAPRTAKSLDLQLSRTRQKAEVYTPSWVCNLQNNEVDAIWFGRDAVFNTADGDAWEPIAGPIEFPAGRRWEEYVDEPRLEITCGEAPYLTSRYDPTTGEPIAFARRVGLLDRKLRVVGERVDGETQWLKWAIRAVQATYGFEFSGDSLLLARENILGTFIDAAQLALRRMPTGGELLTVAEIVSWNLWQMDGLTGAPPMEAGEGAGEGSVATSCLVFNWRTGSADPFNSLVRA